MVADELFWFRASCKDNRLREVLVISLSLVYVDTTPMTVESLMSTPLCVLL